MAKKSSKTTGNSIKVSVAKDSSVSIRQIENGFIVNESGYIGKGKNEKHYSKEFFSKNNPLKISGNGNGGSMKFGGK